MFVDQYFQSLEEKLVCTTLNTTGARDHVQEVETKIQVIKEWMRANHANLTFLRCTGRMTIEPAKHDRGEDTRKNMPRSHRQPTGHLYIFSIRSGKKITGGQFTELSTPTIVMKQVAAMALSEKQNGGLIFENRTGATVNDILPYDEANEVFDKIDENIPGVDWEAEIQEPEAHMPQLNNNKYAALTGKEDDEDNETESTGVGNDGEFTGVQHDDKTTGVDRNIESTVLGCRGATNKEDEMEII